MLARSSFQLTPGRRLTSIKEQLPDVSSHQYHYVYREIDTAPELMATALRANFSIYIDFLPFSSTITFTLYTCLAAPD
jgi:hypothetical protein